MITPLKNELQTFQDRNVWGSLLQIITSTSTITKGTTMHKPTKQDINNINHWAGAIATELSKGSLGGHCSSHYIRHRMTHINNTLAAIAFDDGQRFETKEII